MSKYLSISLIIVSFLLGMGIGFFITPQYAYMSDNESSMKDLGKADRYFDLRYMEAMIAHHQSAIDLATQVKDKTKRPEVKEVAESIIKNEPKLIEELYKWRKEMYNNTSKVPNKNVVKLGNYDENLDLRFINTAIAHHEEGIEMANEATLKSSNNNIILNGFAVSEFLGGSVKTLKNWRSDWYGIK